MSTIPKLHYISQGDSPEQHIDTIREACTSGIELVELRLNNLDEATVLKTAQEARDITGMYHTRLMISDDYKIAKTVKADGIYLNTSDTCPLVVREYLYTWQIIGAAAQSLEDCKTLLEKKVDYIGLGPYKVISIEQHSNPALGLPQYTTLLDTIYTETPVFAFGEIQLEDVPELLKTGIYGIAVSEALTKDFKKIKLFQKLLGGSNTKEQVWNMDDHK
ncbi:thiamine phosphate synthase [Gelidibacter salicanalis]|uniref:Thiamine phosphate synthase n=1 Tax=Gelidibacter salicanalis TaxID=291193 RepID=A0A934NKM4_9FLAO|nr:thiamine phosphate synthase [Gelidibacter salicanalis]MBJ7881357.1 thiamine phosphate synthase [Gelidibacter salicanalis]